MLISDAFYENPPRPHKGCSNRFLTHHEMEHLIQKQSLTILKDWKREGITTLSNGPYTSRVLLCMFK